MPALGLTFAECIRSSPDLEGTLLSAAATQDVSALLGSLPEAFRCGGIECRLQRSERVDVVVCADRRRAKALLPAASGSKCGTLLRHWLEGEGPLSNMSAVCLEFDRPATCLDAMQQSPWATAFPFFRVAEAEARLLPPRSPALLFEALGTEFTASPGALAQALQRALPRGATLLHLAALGHRGEDELRAHVAVDPPSWDAYLGEALASEPEKQRLLRYIVGDFRATLALQLATTTNEFRPISLELSLPHDEAGEQAWAPIFRRLIEASLVAPASARAVQAWASTLEFWPAGAPAKIRTERPFHITLRFSAEVEAKAYLYFYPRYVAD